MSSTEKNTSLLSAGLNDFLTALFWDVFSLFHTTKMYEFVEIQINFLDMNAIWFLDLFCFRWSSAELLPFQRQQQQRYFYSRVFCVSLSLFFTWQWIQKHVLRIQPYWRVSPTNKMKNNIRGFILLFGLDLRGFPANNIDIHTHTRNVTVCLTLLLFIAYLQESSFLILILV